VPIRVIPRIVGHLEMQVDIGIRVARPVGETPFEPTRRKPWVRREDSDDTLEKGSSPGSERWLIPRVELSLFVPILPVFSTIIAPDAAVGIRRAIS
jgi:hypothetical protein